jgi:hypothetical protein
MCYSPYYASILRRWIRYCLLADWYYEYWYGG